MKRVKRIIICTALCLLTSMGCLGKSCFQHYPKPMDFHRGYLEKLPNFNPELFPAFQIDLRCYNLSKLDLAKRYYDLSFADFNTKTVWTKLLPQKFTPDKIMELGKNPGLNTRALHKEGITGKGIGIAIIDQALLLGHTEYKDRVKLYLEVGYNDRPNFFRTASMHGAALSSIAVGKTVGIAPEADLYYFAAPLSDKDQKATYEYYAQALKKIIELVRDGANIRVISMSKGWLPDSTTKGLVELKKEIKIAKENGIFFINTNQFELPGYGISGLGRDLYKDPNNFKEYVSPLYMQKYLKLGRVDYSKYTIFVPIDSRTTASPTGNNEYVFYRAGGTSWTCPWYAGLYALSCQVESNITPNDFIKKSYETGDDVYFKVKGKKTLVGRIINPLKLMESIREDNPIKNI